MLRYRTALQARATERHGSEQIWSPREWRVVRRRYPSDMLESPSAVGARAELAVAVALTRAGRTVYVPLFAAHSRVDLVMEDDHGLHRIQCKSGVVRNGVMSFRTASNTGNVDKGYRGEVEYFGVYASEIDKVYLVPVNVVAERRGYLRLTPPRN